MKKSADLVDLVDLGDLVDLVDFARKKNRKIGRFGLQTEPKLRYDAGRAR